MPLSAQLAQDPVLTHKSTLCFLLLRTTSFGWGVHENSKFAVHRKGHSCICLSRLDLVKRT